MWQRDIISVVYNYHMIDYEGGKMYLQDYKNYVDRLYLDQLFPVKIILIISS